jgi:hypothetical protein
MVSEVQFYAMVDQAAAVALDAIEFNDVGCTMKNCKYFVGKIDSGRTEYYACLHVSAMLGQ